MLNSGFKKTLEGRYSEVKAVAWVPDPAVPGALKVKFFNLFTGDYLIFGLDQEGYSWALVGSNTRDFLWFLSRTPTVSADLLDEDEVHRGRPGLRPVGPVPGAAEGAVEE